MFCVPLTIMVELCLPSFWSSAMALGLLWAGFGHGVGSGSVSGCLRLEIGQARCFPVL